MQAIFREFQTGENRYQDDPVHTYRNNPAYKINQRILASVVGAIAVLLPFVLMAGFAFFGTCFYQSISHFYYSRFFGDVFVVSLAVIATFLIAYRGTNPSESRLATAAGLATFGVALFPTTGAGCTFSPVTGRAFVRMGLGEGSVTQFALPGDSGIAAFELFGASGMLHYIAASVLFGFLAWYSLFVFTRVEKKDRKRGSNQLTETKKLRNTIYVVSGTVILMSIAMLLASVLLEKFNGIVISGGLLDYWTFTFEALALWAFGIAWITKGRVWNRYLLEETEIREMRKTGNAKPD
ncbi:MAG: hypothetical protein M9908_01655 [Phyllobacteriaceae bacterium]|nr:hypothetical protein [Phyllobacteriaceae bacterium]